ncbi:sugar transporter, putative, partial [Eimeria necatrix]
AGSVLGGWIADRLGRRPGLLLSDFCLLFASICFGIGTSFALVLVGRFFVGLGVGMGFVVYATYMCEIAPTDLRGDSSPRPHLVLVGRFFVGLGVGMGFVVYATYMYWRLLRTHHRPILTAVGCAVAQNLTAANSVIYFAIDIFTMAGISDPYLAGAGVGAMKFMGVICCMCLVEKLGRRVLLLLGTFGAVVCHLVIASGFLLQKTVDVHAAAATATDAAAAAAAAADAAAAAGTTPTTLLVVGMLVFMFCWNVSWAALMFVVASEVLPNSCRGVGMGLTITAFWTVAFIMQSTLEPLFVCITIAGKCFK